MYRMLFLVMIINAIIAIMNIFRRILLYKFYKEKKLIRSMWAPWTKDQIISTAIWTLIIFAHPSPFIIGKKREIHNNLINNKIFYYYNDLLHCLQQFKWLIILRGWFFNTVYSTSRAERIW